MAAKDGQSLDSVVDRIRKEPYRFDFFQVVHLFEQFIGEQAGVRRSARALNDALRIRPNLSLGCPSSDLHSLELMPPVDVDDERGRYRLTVNFLGLYGVDSPLPDYYLEEFIQDDDEESLQRRLLDIFHQHLYMLFYVCWKKYRYYIQYHKDGSDPFSQRLFALLGLCGDSRLPVSPHRLLPFISSLSRHECSAHALECVIRELFDTEVHVEQFVVSRVSVDEDQLSRLGIANSRLGSDLLLGREVTSCGSKIRLRFDNLDRDTFVSLLPNGDCRRKVDAVLRHVLPRQFDYEMVLRLDRSQDCSFSLGGEMPGELGLYGWIAAGKSQSVRATIQCGG